MKVKVVPFDQIKIFRRKVAHCHKKQSSRPQKLHFTVEIIYESESGTFWPNKKFSKKSRTLP